MFHVKHMRIIKTFPDVPDSRISDTVTIYNNQDFPFEDIPKTSTFTKHDVGYKNYICTFDIESYTIDLKRGDKIVPEGYMYIWQFCINGRVCMGRTWKEFLDFLCTLKKRCGVKDKYSRLVIYVHFLSYEFQFISRFFEWENVFAKDKRKVIRANTVDNIEFRCSWFLTNKSLDRFCKDEPECYFNKTDGDKFVYDKMRTPETFLSDEELYYCYCDVMGLYQALRGLMKVDNLATIPMTSTGYVRRYCRNAMVKNQNNRRLFEKTACNKRIYELIEMMKRGGNTHGNRFAIGQIVENVHNYDFSSSYPFVLLTEKYPVSRFNKVRVSTYYELRKIFSLEKAMIIHLIITNVKLKEYTPVPYIPLDKCIRKGRVTKFNGRILEADYIEMVVNEVDFTIIESMYSFEKMAVMEMYIAEKDYIPEELAECIRHFFYNKSALKGVDDYNYMKSKNLLNSIFGMCFTNPVHDIIEYDGVWKEERGDINSELEKFYKSRNSFLPFQWGCWVTAYARHNLQKAIDKVGIKMIYTDTDSIKCVNVPENIFSDLNEEMRKKAIERKAYAEVNGRLFLMGQLERENDYKRFCTWGAKKYAYEDSEGGIHITIAGVDKKKGANELVSLENFKIGFEFRDGGGTSSWYNDDDIHYLEVDGCTIETGANVGIHNSTYKLGVTKEFFELCDIPIDRMC